LIDQMMNPPLSPASDTGTAHRGGGNALFYGLEARFLPSLNWAHDYHTGYYTDFFQFYDKVDGQ
jgi:hypothetical protein